MIHYKIPCDSGYITLTAPPPVGVLVTREYKLFFIHIKYRIPHDLYITPQPF